MFRQAGRILSRTRRVVRLLALQLASLLSAVVARADYVLSLWRSPWQITLQWPEQKPAFSGRVAIFAHYDRHGRVGDYVLAHLAGLRDAGCRILFVSNAAKLQEKSLAALKPLCDAILVRKNWSGKWGAWREALRYLGDEIPLSLLLLVDDSSYGPLIPLAPLLDQLDFERADVWGLTDSWQYRWHLQSYFLAVHPRVLGDPAWRKFWNGCTAVKSRRWLYRSCEAGFSQSLIRARLRLEPCFGFHDLCATVDRTPLEADEPESRRAHVRYTQLQQIDHLIAAHDPFDPTQMLWRQLLRLDHPYFSRALLLRNPELVQDLADWPNELASFKGWDVTVIEADLAASAHSEFAVFWHDAVSFLRKVARGIIRRTEEAWGGIVGRLTSHRQAVFVWPDRKIECGPRVVVFVHFDKRGEVRDYVFHYLRALADAGVSILFVSNSGKLRAGDIEALKPLCAGVIVRRNIGYDFGAWREGLEYLKGPLDDLVWLGLANDSVYGPLRPLQLAFNHIDLTKADVWGFTDSEQRTWHLQSYFLIFSRRVLRSSAWRDFWRGVLPASSKSWVISHCEIRITSVLKKAGFQCAALFPYKMLVRDLDPVKRIANNGATLFARLQLRQRLNLTRAIERNYALNPTADLWRQLLRADFPFLKRELLRLNPTGVPDSLDWQTEVAVTSGADVRLIEEDLRQSVRSRLA